MVHVPSPTTESDVVKNFEENELKHNIATLTPATPTMKKENK